MTLIPVAFAKHRRKFVGVVAADEGGIRTLRSGGGIQLDLAVEARCLVVTIKDRALLYPLEEIARLETTPAQLR